MRHLTKFMLIVLLLQLTPTGRTQVPTPLTVSTSTNPAYPRIEPTYSYGFDFPVTADVLFDDPSEYQPEMDSRYFMSVFGPRYKQVSSSNVEYFDFHQGSDMSGVITDGDDVYNDDNPPNIDCMCDGVVDKIEDGDDEHLEHTGGGRYIRVKCDALYNGNADWGHIYMAYRHLSSINPALEVDDVVSTGDWIGVMGESGHTTTTHLHFSVRRKDGNAFHNVHPMRVFDPAAATHLMTHMTDAEITQLEYNANTALFRVAVPYNQGVIRAVTVSLDNTNWFRTYDFEAISETAGDNRDHNDYVAGLEFYAYPFNHGQTAYYRYMDKRDDMPAAYPASPQRGVGNYYPLINEGIFATPAYVLDVKAVDLPNNFDINDVRITVIDIFGNVAEAHGTSQLSGAGNTTVFSIVSDDDDDAEEHADGEVDNGNSDLELVNDGSKGDQTVGLRFTTLGIPQGAAITKAYVQFMADETDDEVTSLVLRAEASDSAAAFDETDNDLSDRTVSTATVDWSPAAWTTVGDAGVAQRTPDLSALVQEAVNRAGWSTDSALAVLITGSGKRVAESHDASSWKAPYLYMEYNDTYAVEVNLEPEIALTSPADNAHFSLMDTVNVAATASDDDGAVERVEFYVDNVLVATDYDAPYMVDWDVQAYGSYTVIAVAYDDEGAYASSEEINIAAFANSFETRITDTNDDVEEHQNGSIAKKGTDLELCYDSYVSSKNGLYGNQFIGLRFQNVVVPAGATITAAYVQFTADETDDDAVDVTVSGEAADSAAAFSYASYDVSDRTPTAATVQWQPAAWDLVGEADFAQRTPDLSTVIQEIVDRQGWSNGNSIALILSGSGTRTAESCNGSAEDAPLLHIEFE